MAIRNCFYIENAGDSTLKWSLINRGLYDTQTEYSIDDTLSWATVTYTQEFTLEPGKKMYFKGTHTPSYCSPDLIMWGTVNDWFGLSALPATAKIKAGGSLMSLIHDGDGDCFEPILFEPQHVFTTFGGAFNGGIRAELDVSELILSPFLTPGYYFKTFKDCTNLVGLHKGFLPATVMAAQCYYEMFSGCANLEEIPQGFMNAKIIKFYDCLTAMFRNCTKLKKIYIEFQEWGVTDASEEATSYWVEGVADSGDIYFPVNLEEKYGVDHFPEGWNVHPYPTNKGSVSGAF